MISLPSIVSCNFSNYGQGSLFTEGEDYGAVVLTTFGQGAHDCMTIDPNQPPVKSSISHVDMDTKDITDSISDVKSRGKLELLNVFFLEFTGEDMDW